MGLRICSPYRDAMFQYMAAIKKPKRSPGSARKKPQMDPDVGKRIAELRNGLGMTQTELGKAAGIDQSTVSDIETKRAGFAAEALIRLAEALHTSPRYIMRGGGPDEQSRTESISSVYGSLDQAGKDHLYAIGQALLIAKPNGTGSTR